MSRRTNRKHFTDASVLVHRQDGRPVGSRIDSVMGTFTVDHWPSKIADVRVDQGLGLLVVETKKGEKKFLGAEDAVAMAESSAGGSAGGHDPRAHGKVRYIVRAFGKWADGKHEVCVKRIRTEHPEIAKGRNVNALCAWLKDQWAGTTKWRGRSSDPKQKAEDAAIVARARESAAARFTHSMPVALDAAALDGLVEDVRALTGITPEQVLAEISAVEADVQESELALIEAGALDELDARDVFQAIFEADAERSASMIAGLHADLSLCVEHASYGPLGPILEAWLALHGAPAAVDDDLASVMEAAERIVRGNANAYVRSEIDGLVMEAAAAAERPAPNVLPLVEALQSGERAGDEPGVLTESERRAAADPMLDDLSEAALTTDSTGALRARVEHRLREAELWTPSRAAALQRISRAQLARTAAMLAPGTAPESDPGARDGQVRLAEYEVVLTPSQVAAVEAEPGLQPGQTVKNSATGLVGVVQEDGSIEVEVDGDDEEPTVDEVTEAQPRAVKTHIRELPDGRLVAVTKHERGFGGRTRDEIRTRSQAVSKGNVTRGERRRAAAEPAPDATATADVETPTAPATPEAVAPEPTTPEAVVAEAFAILDELEEASTRVRTFRVKAPKVAGGFHGRAVRGRERPKHTSQDPAYQRSVKGFSAGAVKRGTGYSKPGGSQRVRRVQTYLHKLGYAVGKADGKFGAKTAGAVKQFQTKHGLKVDGVVGSQTLRHMRYRRLGGRK
jgi:hypothetical protein